ncbi:MAG: DHHA1 domain-containing protein, partial [Chloroflexota bacterium]|nr:DHHA1 domain-containing protein [Chloroflexota bacterium]
VLVLERGAAVSKGSARSIDGFNLFEALGECDDLLDHWGGHAKAAGLTVANERLDALRERLLALAAARLGADDLRPTLTLDVELPLEAVSERTSRALARLEPFGHGNPEPLFLLRGVRARYPKASADGKHLFFRLPGAGGRPVRAVAFGQGARRDELLRAPLVDLAGTLRRSWWAGEASLEFHVRDFRPAGG